MFPFQFATKQDLKESARIERRRAMEEERKKRIFNPRIRQIGVEIQTLNQQIKEKDNLKNTEKELETKFDLELQQRNADLNTKLDKLTAEKKRIQFEIDEYNAKCHRSDHKLDPEFIDPYNPRKNQMINVNDRNWGISSAQIFTGDNVQYEEHRRQQKLQQKAWLQQQSEEKKLLQIQKNEEQKRSEIVSLSWSKRMDEIDENERKLRRQIQYNISKFNSELAHEQQMKRLQKREEENQDNLAEMINVLTSDMMTENKNMGKGSPFGPKRFVVSQYRGMTDDEIEEIRNVQREQIIDNRQRKIIEKIEQQKQDNILFSQVRELSMQETKLNRQRENSYKEITLENAQLSGIQKQNVKAANNNNNNIPSEEYFAQFNTTTR